MIHAPRPRSSTLSRRRPIALTLLAAVGFVALGGCRPSALAAPPQPSHDAAAAASRTQVTDPSDAPVDLGPADPILAPIVSPVPEPYALPPLPRRPRIGRVATGATRHATATAPLLVAVDRPLQVVARDDSYVHVAAWRPDGRPAAGARVFLDDEEIGRADHHGALVVALPVGSTQDTRAETLWVIDGPRCGAVALPPVAHRPGAATDHLYVHADRGVFRAGDTLHLRGLGLRLARDDRPLEGAEVEIMLRDHEGHTVAAATARSDDLGVLAVDLPIGTAAREGLHTVSVAYGSQRAETEVHVRNFSAAQVRIDHTLPLFLSGGAKRLAFDLRLSDPAGEPLRSAELQVVFSVGGKPRLTLQRQVEGGGPHKFELGSRALDRVRAGTKSGDVVVATVQATDREGRRDEVRRELRVTAHRYVAELELDRDRYTTGDPVVVTLRLADLERVPARHEAVELRLSHADTRVDLQAQTDGGGLARFRFDMPSSAVKGEVHVAGVDPAIARLHVPWEPRRAMRAELVQDVATAGARMPVTVHFPGDWVPADDVVHADVVDATGAIVDASLLAVKKERDRWVARGHVIAPAWGTAQLSMFALGRRAAGVGTAPKSELGLLTAGESLIVPTGRELSVELHGVPAKARPGGAIDVQARIRDGRGKSVRAAVGAVLLDSAVLGLDDPLAPSPIDTLHDPRRRTLGATREAAPPWPVLTRNWGEQRVDVARPPFAALAGGRIESCRDTASAVHPTLARREHDAAGTTPVASAARPRPARDPAATRPILTEITLRTRVPTTTMWAPALRGKGEVRIEGRLSSTVGEQELVVVANDEAGGVGLARAKIRTTQPVSVRADLPTAIVVGERVEIPVVVHNATGTRRHFEVELQGGGALESDVIDVAPRRQDFVALALEATERGMLAVGVQARDTDHEDALDRSIAARTAGLPVAHATTARLGEGSTTLEIEIPPGDASNELHLRLHAPEVTTALLGLDALSTAVTDDPGALAVDIASAALLSAWGQAHAMRDDRRARLRGRALAALSLLRLLQRSDGAFGMRRGGEASAYMTTAVLEGLLDADAAQLPVPAETIAGAARWLGRQLAGGRLASIPDTRELIGEADLAREGLTARMFAALARVPKAHRTAAVESALRSQADRWATRIATPELDAVTRAHALSGLVARGRLKTEGIDLAARRLVAARSDGHWASSWFHTHDGRGEATAVIASVLQALAPHASGGAKRHSLLWLVQSRERWGGWHEAPGTASALRAMLQLADPPSERVRIVEVSLDGELVRRITIDPADPLPAFEALSSLELGRDLATGTHVVQIMTTEDLQGLARVVTRLWTPGSVGAAKGHGRRLSVEGPAAIVSGTRVFLRIEASGAKLHGGTIRVAKSGLFEIDRAELARRVGPGRSVESFAIDDEALLLRISPARREVSIAVPLFAARRGTGQLPAVALDPLEGAGALVVDPGPVRVN